MVDDVTKDIPKEYELMRELVEYFGAQEVCRIFRIDGPTLSKMQTPPDAENADNGNHRIGIWERLMWVGNAIRIEILNNETVDDQRKLMKAKFLRDRMARFCGYVLGCHMIPHEDWEAVKRVLNRFGMIVLAFVFIRYWFI
jgi:hypothetical protein